MEDFVKTWETEIRSYDKSILQTSGEPWQWANFVSKWDRDNTSWSEWKTLCELRGQALVSLGIIKPDYRQHRGWKGDGRTYRLSRSWWNAKDQEGVSQ